MEKIRYLVKKQFSKSRTNRKEKEEGWVLRLWFCDLPSKAKRGSGRERSLGEEKRRNRYESPSQPFILFPRVTWSVMLVFFQSVTQQTLRTQCARCPGETMNTAGNPLPLGSSQSVEDRFEDRKASVSVIRPGSASSGKGTLYVLAPVVQGVAKRTGSGIQLDRGSNLP